MDTENRPETVSSGVPDFEALFDLHNPEVCVRILKNEVPPEQFPAALEWLCDRFGREQILESMQNPQNPTVFPETTLPHTDLLHRAYDKVRNLRSRCRGEGVRAGLKSFVQNETVLRDLRKQYSISEILQMPLILFESVPDFTDNTRAVYEYLLTTGLNRTYRFVWITEDTGLRQNRPEDNVYFIPMNAWMHPEIRDEIWGKTAAMLSSNRRIFWRPAPGQISLFLTHGSPLKASPDYNYYNNYSYVLAQSEWLKSYVAYENETDPERLKVLGIPRNDDLFHPDNALEKMEMDGFHRVIVWLPTYRKHAHTDWASNMEPDSDLGIPVLKTVADAERLNQFLRERNLLLVMKPHPQQDTSGLHAASLSNFRIIRDRDLETRQVRLYQLLGAADAMVTDYSSVYYDYLLTDRPIGLTTDDFEQYENKRGFVYANPYDVLKGHRIAEESGFEAFLEDVADGRDPYGEERRRICRLTNDFRDDQSAKRVGDFLISLLQ